MSEEKRKKRSFAIVVMASIMTFALCITLISCGVSETADNESEKIKTEQSAEVKNDGKDVKASQKTEKYEVEKTTQKATQSATQKATTEAATQKATQSATQKATTEAVTQKATQSVTQKATTEATTQAKKVCYITIEGYCSGKEISLQGGDTAYSILCRSGASVSGSGNYIKGINGRFEFDEGPTSGWVYYVNGSKPSVGCGSCSIKAGDSIKWDYVTSY